MFHQKRRHFLQRESSQTILARKETFWWKSQQNICGKSDRIVFHVAFEWRSATLTRYLSMLSGPSNKGPRQRVLQIPIGFNTTWWGGNLSTRGQNARSSNSPSNAVQLSVSSQREIHKRAPQIPHGFQYNPVGVVTSQLEVKTRGLQIPHRLQLNSLISSQREVHKRSVITLNPRKAANWGAKWNPPKIAEYWELHWVSMTDCRNHHKNQATFLHSQETSDWLALDALPSRAAEADNF